VCEAPQSDSSFARRGLGADLTPTLAQDSFAACNVSLELCEPIEILQLTNGELGAEVKKLLFQIT
jgi:hypothetical protein